MIIFITCLVFVFREIKTGAQSYGPGRSARRIQDSGRLLNTVGYGPTYNRRLGSKTYLVDQVR